ncbi:MAG: DbpA RNA binding domain-containing protein [Treponema sp.]|jgi:hypothetical protein|nr:DbpA RNA binding domain-containing protein [Treponema sp.]
MPSQLDREKTGKNIERILDRLSSDADPHVLNEYRRFFKKKVSFFRRSWASAYLLMLYDQGELGRADKNKFRGDRGGNRSRQAVSAAPDGQGADVSNEPRAYPLAEEESKQLFISAGRNRRVFPREILGIINSKTSIPKEDIGAIRILDNYSFVQVRDTVAEQIIEALNGMTFRGRTLTVNYAKSRKDNETEAEVSEQTQEHPEKEYI